MVMETEQKPGTSATEAPVITPASETPPSETPQTTAAPAAQTSPQAPAPIAEQPAAPAAPTAPAVQPLDLSAGFPSNLPPEVQAYVSRLQEQARASEEQAEQQLLTQTVGQYAAQLEQQYQLAPEHALAIAKAQGDIVYKQYQASKLQKTQMRAALAVAKQHNVDPMALLDLPSYEAMQQTAKALSANTQQAQELKDLRAKVDKLTKAAVPAQSFAQGAQPGAGAGLTGDALEKAWLKHETEQPDRPNPYDASYRAMLKG